MRQGDGNWVWQWRIDGAFHEAGRRKHEQRRCLGERRLRRLLKLVGCRWKRRINHGRHEHGRLHRHGRLDGDGRRPE